MQKAKYTARFKFDRVIESIKLDSLSQVARQYGFGVNLMSKWRSAFFKSGHAVFEVKPDQDLARLQKKVG
ncbi:MAG: transposase, partial [Patescibacteria group bacterium]|nr:transposase [Patescibacteria group bacterium]